MQIEIFYLILLLCGSAFFSGVETAFVGLTHIKLENMLKKKAKNAETIHKLKKNPHRLITTILVGNNIVNIALSAIATKLAMDTFGDSGIAIAVGAVTFIVLIFGEIVPKSLAINYSEHITQITAKPLLFISYAIFPIVYIFENIANAITPNKDADPTVTEEELKVMISMGTRENVLEKKEKEFIEGVLEFNDITAREVMTPRVKMFSLPHKMKIKDAIPKINKKGFSRIPIYHTTRDKIIGVIHIKDILEAVANKKTAKTLTSLITEPVIVSENRVINEIFKEMQEKHTHIAIVIDEFGGTEGILTLEDLLEEIVGEIMDESDLSSELILRINKNTVIAHGDTEVDHINNFFNINLPENPKYNTLNGLFHHRLKKIPKKNAKLILGNVILTAKEVSKKKILKIKITKQK